MGPEFDNAPYYNLLFGAPTPKSRLPGQSPFFFP